MFELDPEEWLGSISTNNRGWLYSLLKEKRNNVSEVVIMTILQEKWVV